MLRNVVALLLVIAASAAPAAATDTYVDVTFDRTAWETAVGSFVEETFDDTIPQADVLDFASGIQSVGSDPTGTPAPNHYVDGTLGRFVGTLRTANATAPGYFSFQWTFPQPVTAFGADFFSIGGSREVSVVGTFDSGMEAFDLRSAFVGDGGVDQGFFGLVSQDPFTSITLIALGSIDSNDAFTIDNVVFEVPEPTHQGIVALVVLAVITRLSDRNGRRPHRATG